MNTLLLNTNTWFLPAILCLILVGMFAYSSFRNKKYRAMQNEVISKLKIGDEVKTYGGIFGTIVEIVEKEEGKTAILKTGKDAFTGFIAIDINAVYPLNKLPEVVEVDNETFEKLEKEAKEEKEIAETKEAEAKTETKTAKAPTKKTVAKKTTKAAAKKTEKKD